MFMEMGKWGRAEIQIRHTRKMRRDAASGTHVDVCVCTSGVWVMLSPEANEDSRTARGRELQRR